MPQIKLAQVEKAEQTMDRRQNVRKIKERSKMENRGCEIGTTKTAMERSV